MAGGGMIRELMDDVADAFNPNDLRTLILFVTNRCNLKCYFCCYKDSLNSTGDLPFGHFEKMAKSIPRLKSLLISGGEPYLREDLFDIISLFIRHCGARFISVPNNGFFTDRVLKLTRKFLEREKHAFLTLLFSIDGFAETHDKVRGMKGSHEKAMTSVREMLKLRDEFPNVRITITTVACEENVQELSDWTKYVRETFPTLDYHNMELSRVGMPNIDAVPNIQKINKKFQEVYNEVSKYYNFEKKDNHVYPFLSQGLARMLIRSFDLLRMDIYDKLVNKKEDWPFNCLAGKTIAVVDANGDFRACELRNVLLNLREVDYDIGKALATETNRKEVQEIKKGKCFCTHGCFIGDSQRHVPSNFLYRFWWKLIEDRLHPRIPEAQPSH